MSAPTHAVPSSAEETKLTAREMSALAWLFAMHEKFPANTWGFNPQPGAALRYAVMRRRLEPKGFVAIDRISPTHFRYSLTDAGRAALRSGSPS